MYNLVPMCQFVHATVRLSEIHRSDYVFVCFFTLYAPYLLEYKILCWLRRASLESAQVKLTFPFSLL